MLNEKHNGLIRRYLPKGVALDKVTAKERRVIQNKLNDRPKRYSITEHLVKFTILGV
jgi:IS30 family transposase